MVFVIQVLFCYFDTAALATLTEKDDEMISIEGHHASDLLGQRYRE